MSTGISVLKIVESPGKSTGKAYAYRISDAITGSLYHNPSADLSTEPKSTYGVSHPLTEPPVNGFSCFCQGNATLPAIRCGRASTYGISVRLLDYVPTASPAATWETRPYNDSLRRGVHSWNIDAPQPPRCDTISLCITPLRGRLKALVARTPIKF